MTPEQRATSIRERKHEKKAANGQPATHKIWIRESWEYLPVYSVPIDALILNVDNRRFGAERDLVETRLGRPLDPANDPRDEESVIAILCDSSIDVDEDLGTAVGTPSKDYLALKEDWARRQQAEPLWIRPDGVVRNGNRRLAMLKRLRDEGTEVNWVDAIILDPDDVDEDELFRMEQREQLSENFKKRYQDINALLALKAAAELEGIDWDDPDSLKTVATRLKHYAGRDDAGYALTQLQAIRAVDAYLAHLGIPGRYSAATRQVETFREVGKCMAVFEDEPEDGYELVQAAFAFVNSGRTYQDLRKLRRLFSDDRERFKSLASGIETAEAAAGWAEEELRGDVRGPELSDVTAPEADDADDEEEPVSDTQYPRESVGPVIDTALDEYDAQNLDVVTQLSQVRARLSAITNDKLEKSLQSERGDDVRELVAQIVAWSAGAQSLGEQT